MEMEGSWDALARFGNWEIPLVVVVWLNWHAMFPCNVSSEHTNTINTASERFMVLNILVHVMSQGVENCC